jgi:hypothetical protein
MLTFTRLESKELGASIFRVAHVDGAEDGGNNIIRNAGTYIPIYMPSYTIKLESSSAPL